VLLRNRKFSHKLCILEQKIKINATRKNENGTTTIIKKKMIFEMYVNQK